MVGVLGTYLSIRTAKTRRQKRFMIVWAIIIWSVLAVFVALYVWLEQPWRDYLWVPYLLLLPVMIVGIQRGRLRIQVDEKRHDS